MSDFAGPDATAQRQLRALPSVDEVLRCLDSHYPREVAAAETRRVIGELRSRLKRGESIAIDDIPGTVLRNLSTLDKGSLRRVINATGVVLHTNLGRAPLPTNSSAAGYSNLEYDLAHGRRGKRDVHVAPLLERLTGQPGIVVNNNAAAVYLALHELAAGYEVIVSRGELIEIGDGFRIPDIMAHSGAVLREVGTTNRTRVEDYRDAVNERTRLILRVHPSNFHITGFTQKPELSELAALARDKKIPLYEDLGSGCLVDLKPFGVDEPLVSDSLQSGVDLVSFSGDKLLGGPQAGILAGQQELISRIRRNPMFRALRVDKMIYTSLESVLRHLILHRYQELPALWMISLPAGRIRERAESFVSKLDDLRAEVISGQSVVGGGSTPNQTIPTWLVAITVDDVSNCEKQLRMGEPAVVARIENDQLLVDLRTVFEEEEPALLAALNSYARSR